MNLNIERLIKVLPDAITGWINVFIVIAVIVLVVGILNKATAGKKD